jgi:predicted ATPase/DNA-binding winged helix-turn-helix (wHTH) protein
MPSDSPTIVELTDRTVDLVRQLVVFPDGRQISLTTREAQLLGFLAARAEKDVTRDELLERVWDYRASYATRAVDVTMRRLRAKVEPDEKSPVHLISVHGVGYRFVPVAARTPAPPRSPASQPPVARQVPSQAPSPRLHPGGRSTFVGRLVELALLSSIAQSYRLLSVLGPGGVGKSRLVTQWLEAGWPGPAEWVDLESAEGPVSVAAAVAGALGLVLTGSEGEMVETVGRALAGRGRALLVLDGFERHVGHASETVGRWLELAPDTVFLVTSRERLRLEGERVVDVPPLPMAEARALLLDRLTASGVSVADDDRPIIDSLLDRLDRLPLAIELAAPRARLMSLTALCSRLDERFKLLGGSGTGRTLRAVLDQSWELLTEDERRALTWCSTFVGGFTLESAEVVLDDGVSWPLDRIEALRDKSLLRMGDSPEGAREPRLGLYHSVGDYALERLEERGEREVAFARHAQHLVELGEKLAHGIDRHGGRQRLAALAAEADNLLAVVRRRLGVAPEEAVRAVIALEPLLATRGPVAVFRRLLDEVTPAAERLGDRDRLSRLLVARGIVHRVAGENEAGMRVTSRAREVVAGTGSVTLVRAWAQLALLHSDASRMEEAVAAAEEGLIVARTGGHRAMEGTLVGMLAAFAVMRGDAEVAEHHFVEAIRIDEEVGNEARAALDHANFGLLLTETGRLEEAEERLVTALRLHTAWGNTRGMAMAHQSLATQRARQQRLAEALFHAEEARTLYLSAAYTRYAALADQNCALLAWALKQHPPDPLLRLERVVAAFDELHDALSSGMARVYLASALAQRGSVSRAEEVLRAAEGRFAPLGNARAEGLLRVGWGFVALGRGDRGTAHSAMADGVKSTLFGVQFLADQLARWLAEGP